MRLAFMILPLFLMSCKKDKGPIEVPGIIYYMYGLQNAYGVVETYNKDGYLITSFYSDDEITGGAHILRIDKEGNLIKQKVFKGKDGEPRLYDASKIFKDPNNPGHYVLIADGLIKIDDSLNLIWRLTRPLMAHYWVTDLLDTLNGNFILMGSEIDRLFVWKINSNGEIIDSFVYYFQTPVYRDGVLEVSNGEILIAVDDYETLPNGDKIRPMIFIKLDANLNLIWEKKITLNEMFGGKGIFAPSGLMRTNDNGFILFAAYAIEYDPFPFFGIALKIDSNGNVVNVKKFSREEAVIFGYGFVKLSDGTNMAFLIGVTGSYNKLWKFDDNLNTIFIEEYPMYFTVAVMYEDSENRIILLGDAYVLDYFGDIIFTKLDRDGNILIWSKVYPDE